LFLVSNWNIFEPTLVVIILFNKSYYF